MTEQTMNYSEDMQVLTDYAHYSPQGEVTLPEGVALITKAIRFCRTKKLPRLLVDTTRLVGFPPPLIHERYWFAQEWAHEARGSLVLAVVAREEMIDPQRFGVLAARNAGLETCVSASASEALDWLRTQKIG